MRGPLVAAFVLVLLGSPLGAQWLGYPAKNIPRNADGTPNLSALAPRTADGSPDLSGIWQPTADANDAAGGIEGVVAPKYQINVMRDFKGATPSQPWAAELYKKRQANSIGRWEGDELVVETVGFNDKTWLDGFGHPHSDAMKLTERFRRRDFGHMDIDITIDDPRRTESRFATCNRKSCSPIRN